MSPRGGASRGRLESVRGGAEDLLTVREVAARLKLSTATVYRLCDRAELPHVRISNAIRIAPADLVAFIDRRRTTNHGGRVNISTRRHLLRRD